MAAADAVLAAHPEIAHDFHVAAMLGDDATVRRLLAEDRSRATARSGPREVDALTHLCFSCYLADRARSDGFVRAAMALLDAGADANGGFAEPIPGRAPVRESVLYGAAGVSHHAPLTRLLLERGADPNDEEVPYHAPESYDNAALLELLDSGRVTSESLGSMLLRKTDWHDLDGIRLLLDRGADANAMTMWGKTALHNALLSDNRLEIIELLLDRGADPTIVADRAKRGSHDRLARTGVQIAAWRGRGDVLALLERRGIPTRLDGVDALVAACARGDGDTAAAMADASPGLLAAFAAAGGSLLGRFAGVDNANGVRVVLDLGVPVDAPFAEGEPYFGIPAGSRALHVASWRAAHDTVRLLLARGASPNEPDPNGSTPMALAVRACVDSYWRDRRSPASVEALLAAGGSSRGITLPTGYDAVDALLRPR